MGGVLCQVHTISLVLGSSLYSDRNINLRSLRDFNKLFGEDFIALIQTMIHFIISESVYLNIQSSREC